MSDKFGTMAFSKDLLAVLVLLVVICAPEAAGQPNFAGSVAEDVPSLHSAFTRVFENPAGRDSVSGEFFYVRPSRFYLELEFPIRQVMVIDNERNLTTIYYPDRDRAFVLQGERPAALPIVSGILAALQPDYGLSTLGFEIYDQEISSDTLITYWRHPESNGNIGDFVLAKTDNRLTRAVLTLPSTNGTATTRFYDYASDGAYDIPIVIETETVNSAGRAVERMVFSDLEIDPQIPSDIENFQIPDDATVEYKKW